MQRELLGRERRTYLLPVGPTRRGEEEVGEVRGGAEELGAVEVDDDALLVGVIAVLEHEVAHPHVAVADGVEARAEGVAGAPQLHQQLEHLVRDLPQLQHVLLNAWKEEGEEMSEVDSSSMTEAVKENLSWNTNLS